MCELYSKVGKEDRRKPSCYVDAEREGAVTKTQCHVKRSSIHISTLWIQDLDTKSMRKQL